MKPGDLSPSEEVVVLMSKEEPRPSDPQVATFVPKHDVKKTKETSVYSHGEMTRRLSTTEIDETQVSRDASTLQKIRDFKEQMDQMMSQRGCYISNIIALILPLLLIIFGSVFLGRCKIQPNIPIYLIVAGVFSLLEILYRILRNLAQKSKFLEAFMESQNNRPMIPRVINFVFLTIWFFIGSGWVYSIYYPEAEECHLTLYNFAFWFITLTYIISALTLIGGIALIIYANKCVLK